MKISKSKKELASIISENGGWSDGAGWSSQDRNGSVTFFVDKPWLCGDVWEADSFECVSGFGYHHKLPNWHQTILSRAEYFHLYPAPDADGWVEHDGLVIPVNPDSNVEVKYRNGNVGKQWSAKFYHWIHAGNNNQEDIIAYRLHKPEQVKSTAVGDDGTNLAAKEELEAMEYKPSIEQLAADYRNAKDYADRKQLEADVVKADAEAKLADLVAAGKALGLVLSVVADEPELVITDWRDLQERDVIWFCGDDEQGEGEYSVLEVEHRDYGGQRAVRIDTIGNDYWIDVSDDWRFIRRP